MTNDQLKQAYLKTSYEAETSRGLITIRIGEPNAELDHLIADHGVDTWAFVTAYNPASAACSKAANQQRHQQLRQRIASLGYLAFEGAGRGDDGQWPPETSLLIMGIDRDTAAGLAKEFGQNAIVVGCLNEAAQLLILL